MTTRTLCASCNKPLSTANKTFEDDGFFYHDTCFTCDKCSTHLSSGKYTEMDGERLCSKCMPQETCQSCGYAIATDSSMEVDGKIWHKECFVCVSCRAPLKKFFEKDTQFYCDTCVKQKSCKSCCKCGKPLGETFTKALKKSWHIECFACHNCKAKLTPEDHFREKNGFPYCMNCERKAIPTRKDISNLKSTSHSTPSSSSAPSSSSTPSKTSLSIKPPAPNSSSSSSSAKKITSPRGMNSGESGPKVSSGYEKPATASTNEDAWLESDDFYKD